jgi:hypothetical protein
VKGLAFQACWRCASPDDCGFEAICRAAADRTPVSYGPQIAEIIVDRLASGEMLANICAEDNMPSAKAVYGWIKKEPAFAIAYRQARLVWSHAQMERAIIIASDGSKDLIETDNGLQVDHENIQRSKLIVDTIKWAVSKANRAEFGDHVQIATPETPKTEEQLRAEITQTVMAVNALTNAGGDEAP